jgi:hypothetical protein
VAHVAANARRVNSAIDGRALTGGIRYPSPSG